MNILTQILGFLVGYRHHMQYEIQSPAPKRLCWRIGCHLGGVGKIPALGSQKTFCLLQNPRAGGNHSSKDDWRGTHSSSRFRQRINKKPEARGTHWTELPVERRHRSRSETSPRKSPGTGRVEERLAPRRSARSLWPRGNSLPEGSESCWNT